MSSEVALAAEDTIHDFTFQPIATAAENILQDLTPLIGPGSSLDGRVKEFLQDTVERYANGLENCCAGLYYIQDALTSLCDLLKTWDKASPPDRLDTFLQISKNIQYGIANVADARIAYANLKGFVEEMFQKSLDAYGANAVVEVESKRYFTGQLNLAKSTVQNMGTSIIYHLEQSEMACSSCTTLLENLKKMVHTFLEDESISLALPLEDTPIWSTKPAQEWSALNDTFSQVDQRLLFITDTYKTWFKWNYDTVDAIIEADMKSRISYIALPDVKVQVPPVDEAKPAEHQPRLIHAIVPSDILHISSKDAASCIVTLDSLDLLTDGLTTMKLVCNISGRVGWSLESMVFQCTFAEDPDFPVRIVAYRPKNSEEISNDMLLEPKRCKPRLQLDTSSTSIKWIFTRSLIPWTTRIIPLTFGLSLDLDYKVEASFDLQISFTYRRRLFWKDVITHHAGVSIPVGTMTSAVLVQV
ncbi:hypothetical protein BJ165DRAFT_1508769 [Panaeolus papilionaceus]|nr:hypothetical protein BJ165DRAFT_1508769 [Panaeolus papilionaceus]